MAVRITTVGKSCVFKCEPLFGGCKFGALLLQTMKIDFPSSNLEFSSAAAICFKRSNLLPTTPAAPARRFAP
jgi:hypothetical protein